LADIGRRRILIISHSYKPLLNPRAFRWSAIAEHWASEGATVDIICSPVVGQVSECSINNVNVYRTGSSNLEKIRSSFRSKSRATKTQENDSTSKSLSVVSTFIKLLFKSPIRFVHDLLWKNLYWPDYACLWIAPATKKAIELTSRYNYDAIITVSDPFSSHLVGLEIKETVDSLRWVVDMGDPFSFRDDTPTNNYSLYKNRNVAIERKVLVAADAVSATCLPTADKYIQIVPEVAHKIKVIPPLMSIEPPQKNSTSIFNRNDSIKFLFIGTVYKTIRSPQYLLSLFDKLVKEMKESKLELHFIGGIGDCWQLFQPYTALFDKQIFIHGLRDRSTVASTIDTLQRSFCKATRPFFICWRNSPGRVRIK
jgi:hypothetical protein